MLKKENTVKVSKPSTFQEVEVNDKPSQIPSNWKVGKISAFFNVQGGGTPSTTNSTFWGGSVPWLGPQEMAECKTPFIAKGSRFLSAKGAKSLGNKLIKANSIILSTRAPVGYVKIAANDLYTNQGCHCLNFKSQADNSIYGYYWFLNNTATLVKHATGTTFKELGATKLKNLDYMAPPPNQQKLIAQVLSQQESVINDLTTLVSKLETRLKWFSSQLLTGKLRVKMVPNPDAGSGGEVPQLYKNTEWQEVEVNGEMVEIPKDWSVSNISELIKFKRGSSLNLDVLNFEGKGLRYLRTNELWDGSTISKEPVYFNGDPSFLTLKLSSDWVICFDGFNTVPDKGTVGLVTNKLTGIVGSHLDLICSNVEGVSSFLWAMLLKIPFYQISICKRASGSISVSAGKVKQNFDLISPLKDELPLIEKVLIPLWTELDLTNALIEKEKKKFDYLADILLTGKVILEEVDDDSAETKEAPQG